MCEEDITIKCICGGAVRIYKQNSEDPQGMEPLRFAKCNTCKNVAEFALTAEGAIRKYKNKMDREK